MNLKKLFLTHCEVNKLEISNSQIKKVETLKQFYHDNFKNTFLSNIFSKKKIKPGFYLHGNVGVGKTMILNFFYENFDQSKKRLHFNEFMINFHDFVFKNKKKKKENIIDKFASDIKKKYKLIYFDEFQITNIVDAMILGSLFKKMFDKNIKIIFSSNIKIKDLYKDGLQRDQFIPFIKIMKNMCYEENLIINEDYRKTKKNKNVRFFFPLNETNNFKINKLFRRLTKNKIKEKKVLTIKGRKFKIDNYHEGIARFNFNELCNKNIGSEDYIKISELCNFIIIDNLPDFSDNNSNLQQRFIMLIDIIYEKKIPLMISSEVDLSLIKSSKNLVNPFKRTISRLHELTSINYSYL